MLRVAERCYRKYDRVFMVANFMSEYRKYNNRDLEIRIDAM